MAGGFFGISQSLRDFTILKPICPPYIFLERTSTVSRLITSPSLFLNGAATESMAQETVTKALKKNLDRYKEDTKEKAAKEKEDERFLRGDPWPTFAPQHPSGDKHYQSGWTLNSLTALLHRGVASNNLASVGLAIHCFDGTENYFEPWKPCKVSKKDHCPQGGAWWSASIINEKQDRKSVV